MPDCQVFHLRHRDTSAPLPQAVPTAASGARAGNDDFQLPQIEDTLRFGKSPSAAVLQQLHQQWFKKTQFNGCFGYLTQRVQAVGRVAKSDHTFRVAGQIWCAFCNLSHP